MEQNKKECVSSCHEYTQVYTHTQECQILELELQMFVGHLWVGPLKKQQQCVLLATRTSVQP